MAMECRSPWRLRLWASLALAPLVVLPVRGDQPEMEVRFSASASGSLEWLVVQTDGLHTLERTHFSVERDLSLKVPVKAGLLRILREGVSPVTLELPGGDDLSLEVPPARPGGAALFVLADEPVLPDALELSGESEVRSLDVPKSGIVAASGLAPGSYELSAVYSQGRSIRLRSVQIREGESTDLAPLSLPAVGALKLSVDRPLCALHLNVLIRPLTTDGAESKTEPLRGELSDACSEAVTGLFPGRVLSTLEDGEDHVYAAAEAKIESQKITDAKLAPVVVSIAGRIVTPAGAPVSSARVAATIRTRQTSRKIETTTAGDGSFDLRLPATGAWTLAVGESFLDKAAWKTVQVVPGVNRVNIRVPVIGVDLTIRRADGKEIREPVVVSVDGEGPGNRVARVFQPKDLPDVAIHGLKPGRYRAYAVSKDLYTRGEMSFELTAATPSAHLEALLERPPLTVYLTDAQGEPVRGRIDVGEMTHYGQRVPGIFTLPELPKDTRLQIVPGSGVPICRRVPAGDEIHVVVETGSESLALLFPGRKDWPYVELEGLPESDCPVPLESLHAGSVEAAGSRGELIKGLPAGRFTVITEDGQRISADVPGPPVTVLPAPGAQADQ